MVAELETQVQAHPDSARKVIELLAMAEVGGASYEKIRALLHSMLARVATHEALRKIEKGMK